ncbi:MAG: 4Fe-4S dicluster domain-containing protein [Candidatus Omnitrophota bacterium]|nr:4Fe-4S dicluster domain-containing protein [Candidatus Omnitrophota bacterium]
MPVSYYSITKNDLFDLFARLAEGNRVFVPYKYGDKLHFGEFDPSKESTVELGGVRQSQPFKSFLNPARERVSGKEKDGADPCTSRKNFVFAPMQGKPIIVAGVKACDLSSLILQDYVFLKGDCEDPFYTFHRNNTLIISCDCTYASETCFCIAMSGRPYPTKDFDLNLSSQGGSLIVEAGSDKGRKIVNNYKTFFKGCKAMDLAGRDSKREEVSLQIKDFIKKRETPDTTAINGNVKKNYDNLPLWQDAASTCVECGACNLVCPTCHCFLLSDEGARQKIGRTKIWDACLYKTFAKVAGNHNPRPHLYERMRNRFDKKFAFFPEVLDYFACTGCGRCIEACPGNIDIREVLKGIVTGKWNKPPHDRL